MSDLDQLAEDAARAMGMHVMEDPGNFYPEGLVAFPDHGPGSALRLLTDPRWGFPMLLRIPELGCNYTIHRLPDDRHHVCVHRGDDLENEEVIFHGEFEDLSEAVARALVAAHKTTEGE